VSYSTQHPFSLIALLIMSTESEATSSAPKVPGRRRRMPLRSPCTITAASRHLLLRKRSRMLGSWKVRVSLRSSDDINYVEAATPKRRQHPSLSNDSLDDSTIIDHNIKVAGTGTSMGEILLPESLRLNGRCFSMKYQSGWYEHVC
jgi:hypothetical protein